MEWIDGKGVAFAYGAEHGYLVITGKADVLLARFSVASDDAEQLELACEIVESTITFPLGRGPGRPGGEPELAALAESAKTFAERYEAGESLEGYPHWRHER